VADREHHTGRTVALVGGAALVAWLLLRGKGWGLGGSGRSVGGGVATTSDTSAGTPLAPCRVWIRGRGLELDGAPAELVTVIARCREQGRAEVHATGDAITHTIVDVMRALQRAGVPIDAPPDLVRLARSEPGR
jgi:hypothetical protein